MISFSPLLQWWNFLWQSAGGEALFTYVAVGASIAAAILMSGLKSRFWPPKPRGFRCSEEAIQWAESRFSYSRLSIAAYVGDLLHRQLRVAFLRLEPGTNLVTELGMNRRRRVEFVTALEDDLGINISRGEAEPLTTLTAVVEYLASRHSGTEWEANPNPQSFVVSR